MNKENIVTLKSPYRDDFQINGYRFGKGEKTCCIEVQCVATRFSNYMYAHRS